MKKGISPEEKLLNLIKNQGKGADSGIASAIEINGFKNEAGGISASAEITEQILKRPFSFVRLRRIFKLILLVSVIYLLYTFIYPYINLSRHKIIDSPIVKAEVTDMRPKEGLRPLEFYLKQLRGKQVFNVKAQGLAPLGVSRGLNNMELLSEISLVGIIGGDDPQAAIEDKKIQKTYYLRESQFIRQFQIEDIQDGKIILGYQGERFELYL